MSCKKCGCKPSKCGCESPLETSPCAVIPVCPDVNPCAETFSSKCIIYQGDDNNCLGISKNDTVESAIQTLAEAVAPLVCSTCTYTINLGGVVTPPPSVTIDINGVVYSLGAYGNVANWSNIVTALNLLTLGTWSYTVVGNVITMQVVGQETYSTLTVLQTPNVVVEPVCLAPNTPPCICLYEATVVLNSEDIRTDLGGPYTGYAGKAFGITVPTGKAIEFVSGSSYYNYSGAPYVFPTTPDIIIATYSQPNYQAIDDSGLIEDDASYKRTFPQSAKGDRNMIENQDMLVLITQVSTSSGTSAGTLTVKMLYRFVDYT